MKKSVQAFARALVVRLARMSRRQRRREAAQLAPLPEEWRDFLRARCQHYRRLPIDYRDRFEQQTQVFLAEKRITGVEMEVNVWMQLLVAASAVSLTVGWPEYTWEQLTEVLLYPDNFDRDYNFGGTYAAGVANHWGVVILSMPALNRSFAARSDPYHVGFHEFAHLLDLVGIRFDGIPAFLSDDAIRGWLQIIEREQDRLRRGDSVLDPYGLSNQVELFATAVEAFFQVPVALADHHTELYGFLSEYFCQDPASWTRADSGRESDTL